MKATEILNNVKELLNLSKRRGKSRRRYCRRSGRFIY